MKEYIRFGEIPEDSCSKRGNGIIGDGYECVGKEKGVSVWDCVYNFNTDLYQLVAPHPTQFTSGDFSQSYDPDNCCGCDSNEKIYVVTGVEVGYGADNEPLLKDVRIIKELPFDYFRQKDISDKRLNVEDSRMTLEEKAEVFYYKKYNRTLDIGEEERQKAITEAYIAGAKELERENNHIKEEIEIMTNFCSACKKMHVDENEILKRRIARAKNCMNKLLFIVKSEHLNCKGLTQEAEDFIHDRVCRLRQQGVHCITEEPCIMCDRE